MSLDASFEDAPVTATVSPAPEAASATADAGFADLGAPVQPSAPTANTVAGASNDPDADLDARAGGLLANKSATDWNAIERFMRAVVPWPASDQDAGYVGLWRNNKNTTPNAKRPLWWNGKPYKNIDAFCQGLSWCLQHPDKAEAIYFCTSLQAKNQPKLDKYKNPIAMKLRENAMAFKAIWIDCDIRPDDASGKHYIDQNEAFNALKGFWTKHKLPTPTIVWSGGGFHVYWISNKVLTPDEWYPYANGLKALLIQDGIKCDTGLTTDYVRILRVPGSYNRKYNPPRLVEVLNKIVEYDFSQLDFLKAYSAAAPQQTKVAAPFEAFVDKAHFDTVKLSAVFKGLDAKAGLLSSGYKQRLDPAPIFARCKFLGDAIATGGKDLPEPLWRASLRAVSFMEGGDVLAHEISQGDARYTPDATSAKYDEQVAKGVGYPQCATIEGDGCEACKTCPLRGKIKSPLNTFAPVTATVTDTSQSNPPNQASWTGKLGVSLKNIPPRKWLYGVDLVKGELTVIGSPGGAGKSSLAIGMAICIATNRELLEEKIRGRGNLKALVINGEDSTDEIRRRVCAFSLQHGLVESDLGHLTVVGANDPWVQRISFLTTNGDKSAFNQGGLDALQLALDALRPDVIVLDPLVSFCAGCNVNDNAVMSLVMRKLKEIAARYECAALIVHHTRKGGDAGNVEAISGAAAITNLARRAIMPVPLTDAEVTRLAILRSERFQHFKLVDAKSNLAPRAENAPLYRLVNVELPNPEPPLYPHGDNVQAITRVAFPTQPICDPDELKIELAIMELVDLGKEIEGQRHPYSPSPAGANNKRALLPDAMEAAAKATAPRQWLPSDLEAAVKAAVYKMLGDGRLIDEAMPKDSRFRRSRGLRAMPI